MNSKKLFGIATLALVFSCNKADDVTRDAVIAKFNQLKAAVALVTTGDALILKGLFDAWKVKAEADINGVMINLPASEEEEDFKNCINTGEEHATRTTVKNLYAEFVNLRNSYLQGNDI